MELLLVCINLSGNQCLTLDRNCPPTSDIVMLVLSTKLCLHLIVNFPFVSLYVVCLCVYVCLYVFVCYIKGEYIMYA